MAELASSFWSSSSLGEALSATAQAAGLTPRRLDLPQVPPGLEGEGLGRWIEGAAEWLGLEAEPVEASYGDVEALLAGVGPALLEVREGQAEPRYLCILGASRGAVELLSPELGRGRVPLGVVRDLLCQPLEAPQVAVVDEVLTRAGVSGRRLERARRAILLQALGQARIGGCWLLRLPPGAPFVDLVRKEGILRYLVAFLLSHLLLLVTTIGAWAMIGRGALGGRLEPQWLLAWALLLLTTVPLRMVMSWSRGLFSIGLGQVIKQRLLLGALQLRTREIRHLGAGQLLGRVVESGAVGSLALGTALTAVVSLFELIFAAAILAAGAGGGLHLALLLAWVGLTVALGLGYQRLFGGWTEWRLGMTNDLVERMVGHRTRLAQERRARWHLGEDEALERYLDLSGRLDGRMVQFTLWLSRGWLLVGLLGLMPAFVSGAAMGPLAVGLGGVLLASQALGSLTGTLGGMAGALAAWRQAKLLFQAATRQQPASSPTLAANAIDRGRERGQVVVEADDVVFRFRDRGEPVLRGCSLELRQGDRVLLEGPSGGGKSTLLSVLTGLRQPESGLVLLRGLDHQTIGADGWRRLVAAAPQFQENHVLTGTFAFNLLMGRRWPPTSEDLVEAEAICRELGLGELLDTMPAGMMQIVGETGWRLSHGERSRLFIARALLQGADLILLDESFAALDPENLHRALRCALERAPTLVVVAHP